MTKRLIINADDFGVTRGVNRAVIEAHRRGALTSTSIMVNMPAFEEAADLAKSNPSLGIGLHFALAAGRPVSKPEKVSTLVNRSGFFHNRSALITRIFSNQISMDEVRRELYAQSEKLIWSDIKADHINGDKHIHILPGISRIVTDMAKELGGIVVRVPDEQITVNPLSLAKPANSRALAVLLFRKFWSKHLKRQLTHANIHGNDGFISLFGLVPRRTPTIDDIECLLSKVRNGIVEFMVHPAFYQEEYGEFFENETLAKEREVEFHLLLSGRFRDILSKYEIQLINYRYVNASKAAY